jgi:hypothetical protein
VSGTTGILRATMQSVAVSVQTESRNILAVISTFTCVCGVQKKTSNHWVLAKATPSGIRFMPWDWEMAKRDDITVLCGEGCAAALLSRSLSEWKQLGSAVEH